jgi:hypothetical protein
MKKNGNRKYTPDRQLGIPSEENRGKQTSFTKQEKKEDSNPKKKKGEHKTTHNLAN